MLAPIKVADGTTKPITEDELFCCWLRLPGERSLRDLQRLVQHSVGQRVTLNTLRRYRERGQWIEKALAAELLHEAETNRAAYETIRDRQVRRRAESLDILGEVFDKTLRAARDMVNADAFARKIKHDASPKELSTLIKGLNQLNELYERVMPTWAGDAQSDGPMLDGPVNPLQIASQLQRLANRKPVLTIRGDAVDVSPPDVPVPGVS